MAYNSSRNSAYVSSKPSLLSFVARKPSNSVRTAAAYSFNVYDKFQLKLSSWPAGISVKLLLRLQLLLLRQTAPDQANGYSILVRGNVIPGRSFITIPIVVITLVLYETKKSMRINVGFRGWRPRLTRGSHASRQGELFIRSRMDPIFFNILLSLHAHFAAFSFIFFSSPFFRIIYALRYIPFPATEFTSSVKRNS